MRAVHVHEIGNLGGGASTLIPSRAAARDAADAGLLGVGVVILDGVICFRTTGTGSFVGDVFFWGGSAAAHVSDTIGLSKRKS